MTILKAVRTAVLLGIAASACTGPAAAGDNATQRVISVSGQGEAAGAPDQAQVTAGVQTRAATVIEASRENQAAIDGIMRALTAQGIDQKDIQTSDYSIWPEQRNDPRNDGEVTITGYRVSNTVNVLVNDIDNVGEVLGAVTNAGANTIQGISFRVRDETALEQKARSAAMANARARAEHLADLAGVTLGDVTTVSMISGGGYPVPMMRGSMLAMADRAPAPGISAGQLSVTVQVQVTFAIKD